MEITVNGKVQRFDEEGVDIGRLLQASGVESPEMVTVQLNGQFVARDAYGATLIAPGDEVDFLYFMGGGAGA